MAQGKKKSKQFNLYEKLTKTKSNFDSKQSNIYIYIYIYLFIYIGLFVFYTALTHSAQKFKS